MYRTLLERSLAGFGLTIIDVTYGLPDHPSILQKFVWQFEDCYPQFPRLARFLDYWEHNIEGPLRHVTIAHRRLIKPTEIRFINHQILMQ